MRDEDLRRKEIAVARAEGRLAAFEELRARRIAEKRSEREEAQRERGAGRPSSRLGRGIERELERLRAKGGRR